MRQGGAKGLAGGPGGSDRLAPMGFEFAGATDVGRKRDHNEDALLLLPDHNVAVVCDGMGGHEAGEVASGIGVETVKRFFEIAGDPDATWPFRYDRTKDEGTNLLVVAAQWANQRIRERIVERATVPVFIPPPALCTDNAAMIGAAAFRHLDAARAPQEPIDVRPVAYRSRVEGSSLTAA